MIIRGESGDPLEFDGPNWATLRLMYWLSIFPVARYRLYFYLAALGIFYVSTHVGVVFGWLIFGGFVFPEGGKDQAVEELIEVEAIQSRHNRSELDAEIGRIVALFSSAAQSWYTMMGLEGEFERTAGILEPFLETVANNLFARLDQIDDEQLVVLAIQMIRTLAQSIKTHRNSVRNPSVDLESKLSDSVFAWIRELVPRENGRLLCSLLSDLVFKRAMLPIVSFLIQPHSVDWIIIKLHQMTYPHSQLPKDSIELVFEDTALLDKVYVLVGQVSGKSLLLLNFLINVRSFKRLPDHGECDHLMHKHARDILNQYMSIMDPSTLKTIEKKMESGPTIDKDVFDEAVLDAQAQLGNLLGNFLEYTNGQLHVKPWFSQTAVSPHLVNQVLDSIFEVVDQVCHLDGSPAPNGWIQTRIKQILRLVVRYHLSSTIQTSVGRYLDYFSPSNRQRLYLELIRSILRIVRNGKLPNSDHGLSKQHFMELGCGSRILMCVMTRSKTQASISRLFDLFHDPNFGQCLVLGLLDNFVQAMCSGSLASN